MGACVIDDYTRAIRATRVIDGDTFVADADLGYHTTAAGLTFRVARINAPETRGPSKDAGIAARVWVMSWLALHNSHAGLFATSYKTDDWRRYIAEITCSEGHNLSDDMLAAGQAVLYK